MDKKWKKVAKENYKALENIDPDKASKDQFLLYSASVALLDHFELKDTSINLALETSPQSANEVAQVDYVLGSRIDEEMQISLQHFINYMGEKSKFQTTGAQLHDDYACEHLKKKLKTDEYVASMLYNSADAEEKALIKQSYKDILARF